MLCKAFLTVACLFVLGACMQTENSNQNDKLLYGPAPGSTGFSTARFIMAQNCSSCHSYHTMSEADLINAGLVKSGSGGDPTQSKIYYRLKGTAGAGPHDMPQNGGLSSSDIADISDWLKNVP
jgi:mono/diheme cytochrome c family protein